MGGSFAKIQEEMRLVQAEMWVEYRVQKLLLEQLLGLELQEARSSELTPLEGGLLHLIHLSL